MPDDHVLVAGGGGFIGGHLVARLLETGHRVRAADVKPLGEWYQRFDRADNQRFDLRRLEDCERAVHGVTRVYNLAADMGGMGFIENNKALCMLSVLINTHLLMACRDQAIHRYFFASSACVYNGEKQKNPLIAGLREEDAYPADPEDGYGWEKLFSERMCRHFMEDFGIQCRVARIHNVYGPYGTWTGGREKAPAAICRKVAEAKASGRHRIEVWGDGRQTRSFMWIDDCIHGIERLVESDVSEPINLGSSEKVSIDELVDIVAEIAGIELERDYDLTAPKGVNGRNSDNTLIERLLGWQPDTTLRDGMRSTYEWIEAQYTASAGGTSRLEQ